MSHLSVAQIIMDAQRMASRVKDLDALGSSLLLEAESNNRYIGSLRQFQDDIDSLNRLSNNKSNAEMVNRIQQQNAQSLEILKENRELKVCIEDYERAIELIMQKYREHINNKVLESKINLKEAYNEKLWSIIKEQTDKINEMAAVMQRAADVGDVDECRNVELLAYVTRENKTLRELLQISQNFSQNNWCVRCEEKGVQTCEDVSADLTSSLESTGNTDQSVMQTSVASVALIGGNESETLSTDNLTGLPSQHTDLTSKIIKTSHNNSLESSNPNGSKIICNDNLSTLESSKEEPLTNKTST